MIDLEQQVKDVSRKVITVSLDTGTAELIGLEQKLPFDRDDIWKACTDPESIERWYRPISGRLFPGGKYYLKENASGEVLSCDPPRRFRITWEFGGESSSVELRVSEPEDGACTLTLEQTIQASERAWLAFGPGALGLGWDMMLVNLNSYLKAGGKDTTMSLSWIIGEDGREFLSSAIDNWQQAAVDGGDHPEDAREAAERVRKAFLGD